MEYYSIKDLVELANNYKTPISEIVIREEIEESDKNKNQLIKEMNKNLKVMKEAVKSGIKGNIKSESGLTGGEAARLNTETKEGDIYRQAIIKALAIAEVNAGMGKIVAGPTAGASGIVPAVILTIQEKINLDDNTVCKSLFTAGGLGNIVARKATLAGAAGGCQAECGVASAMAAGAAVELRKGTPIMVANAFALALKNMLGLVCDPVAGLVEVPCVKRNGFAATHALTAMNMALAGIESVIPPDEVIEAMTNVGNLLPDSLKETSRAGLATTPTGIEIKDNLQ